MSSHASNVDPKTAELWDKSHYQHDVISTRTFGYFMYLLSDGMLFATLFAAYGVLSYQHSYFGGPTPADFVKPWYTFAQTMALFLSVLAYGFGMNALKHKNKSAVSKRIPGLDKVGRGRTTKITVLVTQYAISGKKCRKQHAVAQQIHEITKGAGGDHIMLIVTFIP